MAPLSRRSLLIAAGVAPAVARAVPLAAGAPPAPLAHLTLGRLGHGPRPGDVAAFLARGRSDPARLRAYLEEQLHPSQCADDACEAALAAAGLVTLDKPVERLWAEHWLPFPVPRAEDGGVAGALAPAGADGGTPPDGGVPAMAPAPADPRRPRDDNERRLQPMREVELATWIRATTSNRQLLEVMVGFWHDHFSVYAREGQVAATFAHLDGAVIRPHALGNFRALLEAVARSPSMLVYLDNFTNQSGNANENFARELFELHTLGSASYLGTRPRESVGVRSGLAEGYVDGDVYEAARCFTGWRLDPSTGAFQYFEPWHDRFQKVVLGRHLPEYQPPQKDGQDVLDLLAGHHGTARYLVTKLCTRLLGVAPQALVARAASVFLSSHEAEDQLAQVVRTLVESEDFLTLPRLALRRPFEATVAMLRALGASFFPGEAFLESYARAGQRLFAWRTPDGYPVAAERWAGATPLLERFRLANQLCANALDGVRVDLLRECGEARAPRAVAELWAHRALGQADAPAVDALTSLLAQGRRPGAPLPEPLLKERLPAAVALAFMAPGFQWR